MPPLPKRPDTVLDKLLHIKKVSMGYLYSMSDSSLECQWCGKHLGNATNVTHLNGNQPICDLCLLRARLKPDSGITGWKWSVALPESEH